MRSVPTRRLHTQTVLYFNESVLHKVITFCVDLSFSSNAKCYKILKIIVSPIAASSRKRKYVYTGLVPIT